MLTSCDDPNTQKQLRRSEQIKKWNERENMNMNSMQMIMDQKQQLYQRPIKVRFPKGCVFLAACSSGDADEVKAHLKMGVNINTTNIDGLTALHQACIDANIEMVRFLVENNADINSQDNEGWTPLHAAVSVGNLDVSKYLINKGAYLNMCNNDSDLPIDLCDASNGQMKEFLDEEMQRQAIDPEYERRKEELIMYEDARKMNFEDKVQAKTGATALHVSAAKGYTRVMKLLLQSGANVNALDKDGWTSLHAAAHWEQEEACKILAENGADFSIKTFSDQSIYDVCDSEMVGKLKQLEQAAKHLTTNGNNKLADVTSMNNQFNKTDASNRNRRVSDEYNKSSIVRLTNEAKSTIGDREKKQEKILLSPVPAVNSNTSSNNAFEFGNSEAEKTNKINKHKESEDPIPTNGHSKKQPTAETTRSEDHLTFNKENNNSTSTTNNMPSPQLNNNNNNNNQSSDSSSASSNSQQPFTRQLYGGKPSHKTGLHENLKSLSAQVRMMEEDTPPVPEPVISSSIYHRRIGQATDESIKSAATPTLPASSPPVVPSTPPQVSTTITLSNKNLSPKVATSVDANSNQTVAGSPNSGVDNRRYSSAPVASKDEQAELIRKQKAKLERHFRRSTTAVSYEDIKSAEATIKGTGSNSNLSKTDQADQTSMPPPASTTSLSNQPSDQNQHTTQSLPVQASNSQINGVSSLSSLFEKTNSLPPTSSSSATTTTSSTSGPNSSSLSVNLASAATINLQPPSTTTSSHSNYTKIDASQVGPNTQHIQESSTSVTPTSSLSTNSSTETSSSHLIANDIETDKLLNVIEKSKGFSDSKSTTARRLRNKPIVLSTLASLSHMNSGHSGAGAEGQDLSSSAKSKVQSLRWNEEKLELEVVRKEREAELNRTNELLFNNKENTHHREGNVRSPSTGSSVGASVVGTKQQSSPPNYLLKRQNSGPSLESTNGSNMDNNGTSVTASGRQTFRFGQNDNATGQSANMPYTPYSTNSLNRTNIKRSVSQVPSTDSRRALTATSSNPISYTSSTTMSTNQTPTNVAGSPMSGNGNLAPAIRALSTIEDATKQPFDYQAAYELMKKENESLNQTVLKLNKELDENFKRASSSTSENSDYVDKKEKRAFDRRISELEEEVKKMDNLKQDNNRLKEENAALIRVISKLSK